MTKRSGPWPRGRWLFVVGVGLVVAATAPTMFWQGEGQVGATVIKGVGDGVNVQAATPTSTKVPFRPPGVSVSATATAFYVPQPQAQPAPAQISSESTAPTATKLPFRPPVAAPTATKLPFIAPPGVATPTATKLPFRPPRASP